MTIRDILPILSQSVRDVNPQLSLAKSKQNDSTGILKPRRGIMNQTEIEYALILTGMVNRGEILRYEFEGITLRWADMRYTPDFVVFEAVHIVGTDHSELATQVKLIEVKGGWTKGKFERAVERFRHAKTYYGDVFAFELHQKTKDGWKRIY